MNDDKLVPLTALVGEGFAATPGELVDRLAAEGVAIATDGAGRLAVATAVAERLRQERDRAERKAAQQAARRQREAAERNAAQRAEREAANERRRRQHERIRRLERASGLGVVALEMAYRKERANRGGAGMMYADRAVEDERPIGLDELERWVLDTYGTLEASR